MDLQLNGRVALVTGAGGGFGAAIADALLEEGCVVYRGDVCPPEAFQPSNVGKPHDIAMDVSRPGDVADRIHRIVAEQGRLDILVNNAGLLKMGAVMDSSFEDWDAVCGVNLSGVYYCCRSVVPVMIARRYGKIVNIASVSAFKGGGVFGNTLYGTTKAGVVALTKGIGREMARYGINVNAVAPGLAETGMTQRHLSGDSRSDVVAGIPAGRLATTRDIANAVLFLASDVSSYVMGETLVVDGAYLTR
jgi:3-oxoacyl-[acyl-carrier protein] reductase